ncbi:MAG: AbrB/MazE/SpoVT family DNA-binding domain-containing protein [Chloroflexi bacterium]|nr:AbrB/MazE/SpoVT family DNA-binding domain-containing protein [Chloroflexota bacterium]
MLRERRQLALPREICERLGIDIGDRVELSVEGDALIARPTKRRALDALREIQAAFAGAAVSEGELLRASRQVRRQVTAERYGKKP